METNHTHIQNQDEMVRLTQYRSGGQPKPTYSDLLESMDRAGQSHLQPTIQMHTIQVRGGRSPIHPKDGPNTED